MFRNVKHHQTAYRNFQKKRNNLWRRLSIEVFFNSTTVCRPCLMMTSVESLRTSYMAQKVAKSSLIWCSVPKSFVVSGLTNLILCRYSTNCTPVSGYLAKLSWWRLYRVVISSASAHLQQICELIVTLRNELIVYYLQMPATCQWPQCESFLD